jgi:hypothetical protein
MRTSLTPMRLLGAVLSAVFVSTLMTFCVVMVLGSVAWLGGYPAIALLLVVGFSVWIGGFVLVLRASLGGWGSNAHDQQQAASNISLQADRER